MKMILALSAVALLSGCPLQPWETAPMVHQCTAEQMVKIEKETAFCKAQGGYTSAYCYGAAIMRNCERKK